MRAIARDFAGLRGGCAVARMFACFRYCPGMGEGDGQGIRSGFARAWARMFACLRICPSVFVARLSCATEMPLRRHMRETPFRHPRGRQGGRKSGVGLTLDHPPMDFFLEGFAQQWEPA
jgi:hypothetical protein